MPLLDHCKRAMSQPLLRSLPFRIERIANAPKTQPEYASPQRAAQLETQVHNLRHAQQLEQENAERRARGKPLVPRFTRHYDAPLYTKEVDVQGEVASKSVLERWAADSTDKWKQDALLAPEAGVDAVLGGLPFFKEGGCKRPGVPLLLPANTEISGVGFVVYSELDAVHDSFEGCQMPTHTHTPICTFPFLAIEKRFPPHDHTKICLLKRASSSGRFASSSNSRTLSKFSSARVVVAVPTTWMSLQDYEKAIEAALSGAERGSYRSSPLPPAVSSAGGRVGFLLNALQSGLERYRDSVETLQGELSPEEYEDLQSLHDVLFEWHRTNFRREVSAVAMPFPSRGPSCLLRVPSGVAKFFALSFAAAQEALLEEDLPDSLWEAYTETVENLLPFVGKAEWRL